MFTSEMLINTVCLMKPKGIHQGANELKGESTKAWQPECELSIKGNLDDARMIERLFVNVSLN